MLPLDVYLQNEDHLVMSTTTGEVVDELKGTYGEKLLRTDPEARVVVNFHGVSHSLLLYQPIFCRFLHHLERRSLGSRLASIDLSINLRHPSYSPPDL